MCLITLLFVSCKPYMTDNTDVHGMSVTNGMRVTNISSDSNGGCKYCYELKSNNSSFVSTTNIYSDKEFKVGQRITICLVNEDKIFDTILLHGEKQLKIADSIYYGKK